MIFAILLRVIFTKISKKYQTDKVEKTRQVSSFVFSFLFPFFFFDFLTVEQKSQICTVCVILLINKFF